MPDRLYHARFHPPNMMDRILAHWVELFIALFGIFRGVTGGLGFRYGFVPPFLGYISSASLIIGGLVWILAIARRYKTLNQYYFVLRTALGLSFLGWASHFLPAIVWRPTQVLTWSTMILLCSCIAGLYVQTFINERTIRKQGVPSNE